MSTKTKEIKNWIRNERHMEYHESVDAELTDFYERWFVHRSEFKFLKRHYERFKEDLVNPKRSLDLKNKAVRALCVANSKTEWGLLMSTITDHFLDKVPFGMYDGLPLTSAGVSIIGLPLMKHALSLFQHIIFTVGSVAENAQDAAVNDQKFVHYTKRMNELRYKFVPLFLQLFDRASEYFSPFDAAVSNITGSGLDCSHWQFDRCIYELKQILGKPSGEVKQLQPSDVFFMVENCSKMLLCDTRIPQLTAEDRSLFFPCYFGAMEWIWASAYFLNFENHDCQILSEILTLARSFIRTCAVGEDNWEIAVLSHYISVLHGIGSRCAECCLPADKKCSWCRLPRYCSPECQKKAWGSHKPFCSKNNPIKVEDFVAGIAKVPPWRLPIPEEKAHLFVSCALPNYCSMATHYAEPDDS